MALDNLPKSTHNEETMVHAARVVLFNDVHKEDFPLVGEKGVLLSEMVKSGVAVPDGFIISSKEYFSFLHDNNLGTKINHLLGSINFDSPESLLQVASHIQKQILQSNLNPNFVKDLFLSYQTLDPRLTDLPVTLVSTSTAQNQHIVSDESTSMQLSVKGDANLLLAVKKLWSQNFTPNQLQYRHQKKLDHFRTGVALILQKIIVPDLSGTIQTIELETSDKSKVIILSSTNLKYKVDKSTREILPSQISEKNKALSDTQILSLFEAGQLLENHFYFPQEIAWIISKGKIYITHTKPLTPLHPEHIEGQRLSQPFKMMDKNDIVKPSLGHANVLISGKSVFPGIVSGPIRVIQTVKDIKKILPGDIVVLSFLPRENLSTFRKAHGIILTTDNLTSMDMITIREIGIPTLYTNQDSIYLKDGLVVTQNCVKGEVSLGGIQKSSSTVLEKPSTDKRTSKTQIYLNVTSDKLDFASLEIAGGLVHGDRFIKSIGIHPKKIIHEGKAHEYSMNLAQLIESFCQALYPRILVYQLSNLTTHDYQKLNAGKEYETHEENPTLGYRGTYRYIHEPEILRLELEAIKHVRTKKGFSNLSVMIPYIRNLSELNEVKKIIASVGLHRSPTFNIWASLQIPSNIFQSEVFLSSDIDGINLDTTMLTTLMQGTDSENSDVLRIFNEEDQSMISLYEKSIASAKNHNLLTSVSGSSVNFSNSFIEKLLSWEVNTIIVDQAAYETTKRIIKEV